jgi:hypothetical protein
MPVPEPPKEEAKATWTAIPTPAWSPEKESEPVQAPAPVQPEPEPEPEREPVPIYVAPVPASMAPTPPPPSMVTRAPAPAPPVRKPPAPRRPVYDQPSARPSWLLPAIAGVVILLLLLVGGGIYLAKRGGSNNPVATVSPSAKTSPKTSPKATPSPTGTALQAVPTYAPAASAPLTKVQFCLPAATCVGGTSADTNCQLGGPCHIDIGIYWTGQGSVSQLTYVVHFFDRCTGKDDTVFNRLDATKTIAKQVSWIPAPNGGYPVTVPTGAKAAAIVAVVTTDKGVSAASAPYDLPGSAASCA